MAITDDDRFADGRCDYCGDRTRVRVRPSEFSLPRGICEGCAEEAKADFVAAHHYELDDAQAIEEGERNPE